MDEKNRVRAKIDGADKDSDITVAGGSLVENAQSKIPLSNRGGDVELEATNVAGKVVVVGGDVLKFSKEVAVPLDELSELLQTNLAQKSQIEDLQEIVAELKEQTSKPVEAQNKSKVSRLMDGIGNYIGLATLAATQADKAVKLFEMVKKLVTGS
jgi:hypothetical protein